MVRVKVLKKQLSKLLVATLALSFFGLAQPAPAAAYDGTITVNFHYQRADQTMNDWKAWVWCQDGSGTWGTGAYQAAANASGSCTNGAYISLHNANKVADQVAQFTITGATGVSKIGVIMYKASGSTNIYNGVTRDSQSGSDRSINLVAASTDAVVTDGSPTITTSVYNPPTPTPTPTSTTSPSPSPTSSPLNGDFTVTIHYANQELVTTKKSFYTHVWLTDANGVDAVGTISEGSDPKADKDGMDSFGAVLTLHVSGAVNVSKVGVIQYSIAAGDTTNTWIKDAASANDRFITLQDVNTEVWMRSALADTAITYGSAGDPLAPNRPAVQTFKIHYNRSDGLYDGWKIWFGTQSKLMRPAGVTLPWIQSSFIDLTNPTTIPGPTGLQTSTVGVDGFGPWVQFTLPYYAGHADWANMVVAKGDWSEKDGGKQILGDTANSGNRYFQTNVSGTNEIWLLSGDTTSNGSNCAYASSPFGPPTITTLSTPSAYRGGTVTVTGTNLQPATLAAPAITSTATPLVTVGTSNAVVTASTATTVTFTVPTEVAIGAQDVVVSTAGGPSDKLSLTVLHDPPTFESITPDLIHRGDVVTVNGANFEQTSSVKIGNTSVTIDPSSNDTAITFTVPNSVTPGTYDLTVTSKWGTSVKKDFVVVPDRPTITSFSPKTGKAGTKVTINGTSLATTSKVEFAGQLADLTTATITDTSIIVDVPVTIPGNIKVTTAGGDVTSTDSFAFLADAPTVTSVDPTGVHRGQMLTISGTNLLGATVTVGGFEADPTLFVNASSDALTITVPAEVAIGAGAKVIVTTSGGSDATATVTILPDPPLIESLSSTQGGVGDLLTINGSALGGVVKVTFNGDGQSDPVDADLTLEGAGVTDTAVTVFVPDGVSTGTITVTDKDNQTADSAETFSVFPKPEITTVQNIDGIDISETAPVMRGDTVVVTGLNFGDTPTVKVGDVDAEVAIDVSGDTSLQFTVPNEAPFGQTTVGVKGPGGTTTADFWVVPGAPTIDALSANAGKVGDLLIISGLNLSTTTSVSFDGDGTPVLADIQDPDTVLSDYSVTVKVPEGTTTGPITITTTVGTATSADLPDGAGLFTIVAPPTIDSIDPTQGLVDATVTITGTNLSGATVTVGEAEAVISETSTETSLVFTVPAVALGATTIVVTTLGGSASTSFTVIPPAPKISSLSSSTGKVGATITLTGTDLTDATVKVRNTSATITGTPTDTSITFTVPSVALGATTVVVTTAGGSDSKSFTVIAAPKITSFKQSKSTKRGVGTVTVTGTNLKGATVKVGALKATVRSSTTTSIIFTLPATARATTKGTFTVTTAGGSATSKATLKITLK